MGWEISFGVGLLYFTCEAKRLKLLSQIEECLCHRVLLHRHLDKLLGLLQWVLHGLPALRPWLCTLYDDSFPLFWMRSFASLAARPAQAFVKAQLCFLPGTKRCRAKPIYPQYQSLSSQQKDSGILRLRELP